MTEEEVRQLAQTAFREGVMQARAEFSADLRALADDMVEQIFQLRCELRKAIGLPPLANDRDTLQ